MAKIEIKNVNEAFCDFLCIQGQAVFPLNSEDRINGAKELVEILNFHEELISAYKELLELYKQRFSAAYSIDKIRIKEAEELLSKAKTQTQGEVKKEQS